MQKIEYSGALVKFICLIQKAFLLTSIIGMDRRSNNQGCFPHVSPVRSALNVTKALLCKAFVVLGVKLHALFTCTCDFHVLNLK